jgi:hypothetical protein
VSVDSPPGGLGRIVEHDPRSRHYVDPAARRVARELDRVVQYERYIKAWDQGDVGACTGFAMGGLLMTVPFYRATLLLRQKHAFGLYSKATAVDEFRGRWLPTDTGSSGLGVMKAARALGYISTFTHGFGYDDAKAIIATKPFITGTNWYCLPDDQRVLTSDLRWVPIQKVQVGDELIGFDECIGTKARMRRSTVEDLSVIHQPVYEVTTERGTVVASGGHQFVRCHAKAGQEWARADELQPGDHLAYYLDPYDEDTSWEAGWLAGFFDGEGSVAGGRQVNFAQRVGPTLERALRMLAAKGYETTVKHVRLPGEHESMIRGRRIVNTQEIHNVYVTAPYSGALRFLGSIRPERLVASAHEIWEGRSPIGKRRPPVEVQSVKPLGVEPVHAIGTSTRTLIVEGMLSHNSSFNRPGAYGRIRLGAGAYVQGGHEYEIVGYDPVDDEWLAMNSWSPFWGYHGSFIIPGRVYRRLLDERGDITTIGEL